MSYPRQLQILIIEDETSVIDDYKSFFESLKKHHDLAPPVFARSYQDGLDNLKSDQIFHLAIVDLGLPQATRGAPQEGIDPGLGLLKLAAQRDDLPLPCLVVVSGRIGTAPELSDLTTTLHEGFWFGEKANKPYYDKDVSRAVQKALDYTSIGIHIRSKKGLWPTLSPREDDLLRRCALAQTDCIGLDLEWWSHSKSFSGTPAEKKILAGRFLSKDGQGSSRPTFFKFEESRFALTSHHDTAIMGQRLGHIKQVFAIKTQARSLLVTQQVGTESTYPISFTDLLSREINDSPTIFARLLREIRDQLARLCPETHDHLPLKDLLWKHNDPTQIERAFSQFGNNQEFDALNIFRNIMTSSTRVWVKRRSCIHGDLNATNIAVEEHDSGFHAYIFDAEGIHPDVNVRDLAMLEVTTLLYFQAVEPIRSILSILYPPKTLEVTASAEGSIYLRNALNLIRELRKIVSEMCEPHIYSVMVFDCAMAQVGGLALQPEGNKIVNPIDALDLAEKASQWMNSLATPNEAS